MAQYNWRDIFFMGAHYVALLFSLVISIVVMSFILAADGEHSRFHITNTYLSQYDSDSPLITYIPVSEPYTKDQVKDTFYTCLMTAEVATDDVYKCKKGDLSAYTTCINGLVTIPLRVKRMLASIKGILGDYEGDSVEVSQLPNWLTSVGTPTQLESVLTSDTSRFALKQQLNLQSTPLSIRILEAIKSAEDMGGIPACLNTLSRTTLVEYSQAYDLSTAFDTLWKCTSDVIVVEPIQKRAYEKCIPLSAWPAKDIMQTPYTDTLFGSYNKYFLAWIGAWLMCSFAVYTAPGWPSKPSLNGKPEHFFARAGKFLVIFGFIWNLAAVIIVLVRSFSPADSWKDAPMSIQTVLWTLLFTITASLYFGREIYELFFLSEGKSPQIFKGMFTSTSAVYQQQRYSTGKRYRALSAFMTVPEAPLTEVSDEQYTPLVAPVWNDAWFFVDALLFLAFAGISYDVVTVDIVISVFCILAAALSNSALVRLLYEGYMNGGASNDNSIFVVRVMAMIATIMGIILSLVVIILIGMRFKAGMLTFYTAATTLVPQVFWLVMALCLDAKIITSLKIFFRVLSSFFSLNLVIRASFLCYLVSNFNFDYDHTVKNDDSLEKLLGYINTEGVRLYSYI